MKSVWKNTKNIINRNKRKISKTFLNNKNGMVDRENFFEAGPETTFPNEGQIEFIKVNRKISERQMSRYRQ